MTGYGTASAADDKFEVSAEIKTLNSKFADVQVRLPVQWSSLELPLRKQVTGALVRGKISVVIEVTNKAGEDEVLFDEEVLARYYRQFKRAADKLRSGNVDFFSLALHAPGVLKTVEDNLDADVSGLINTAVREAIANCDRFRQQEGEELRHKLAGYCQVIAGLAAKIDPFDQERIGKIEEKMRAGLANKATGMEADDNRFEQELIYYIEKLDISEEKVRLANHLAYFEEVLNGEEQNGKKLGFIAQEIGREINTIGAKAADARIQRIVVEMKEELEKIKEQVLNVL